MNTRHLASAALAAALLAGLLVAPAAGRTRWRRAFVVDSRLAALRSAPGLAAPLLTRLRAGRAVSLVGRARDRDGYVWVRVAVTRRTRGWLLETAVAAPGDAGGERRLAALLAGLDGIARLQLAHLAIAHFPRQRAAAADAAREEAEAAAEELSARVGRRLGALAGVAPETVRALMLSDPALDRYNRLGVTFEVDVNARRYLPQRTHGNAVDRHRQRRR